MGYRFAVQDANILAYLTSKSDVVIPRFKRGQLSLFLWAVDQVSGRIPNSQRRVGFISADLEWQKHVKDIGRTAANRIERLPESVGYTEYLGEEVVKEVLKPLRDILSSYFLFGLTIPGGRRDDELEQFALSAAMSSQKQALYLIVERHRSGVPLSWLDPFPMLQQLSEAVRLPGMLYWTSNGQSSYAPLDEAGSLQAQLSRALNEGREDALDDVLSEHHVAGGQKRILHLSDLHCGTAKSRESQQLLLNELDRVIPTVDRVVITGDLCDEPNSGSFTEFKNLNWMLRKLSDKPPVIIPGNHDQKIMGNIPSSLRQVADLEWNNVVFDEEMGATFICFDSSKDANLARGRVTDKQKREVANEYELQLSKHPERVDFLKIALVHHHPFSFETGEDSLLNRLLGVFGLSDEPFLQMEDGNEFIHWCAKRGIPLVLHGHKHVPRHVMKFVELDPSNAQARWPVTSIGCGSSLGAENKPVSYNVINWNPVTKSWGAAFYADNGDGSGFKNLKVIATHM